MRPVQGIIDDCLSTIHELLAGKPAAAVAFIGSGCPPLTYGGLRAHVERTVASLNRLGIGRNDRVALVLPNGTEMATAFIAVAAGTTSAPLNPAYRAEEFEFYLSDLKAKALIVERGSASATAPGVALPEPASMQSSPARNAAAKLKIPVIEMVRASTDPAGVFELIPGRGRQDQPPCRHPAGWLKTGRRRLGAAHLRHHLASQDRAAVAA